MHEHVVVQVLPATSHLEHSTLCALFRPEPHILLFRRPNGTDPATGLVNGKRIDPATGKVVPV